MVRNKPLLMIHSLEPKGEAVTGPIAAFGVSFPYGDYSTTINVVVNKVWLQQMQGYADDPDEEIGRASCRERVCQYVYISVVAVSLTKKNKTDTIDSKTNKP